MKKYSIAYKGLKNGLHTFQFKVDGALFEAFEGTEIKAGACDVKVDMQRSETMLELSVSITGSVVVACDRCLEDCSIPVDFDGVLLVKFSDEIRDYDGEVMWLSPTESEVELAQYIYESIVLQLPYQRVHPLGKCDPEMLKHFNIISDEELAAIEAKANRGGQKPQTEWGELTELKLRMEAAERQEETGNEK